MDLYYVQPLGLSQLEYGVILEDFLLWRPPPARLVTNWLRRATTLLPMPPHPVCNRARCSGYPDDDDHVNGSTRSREL